ncbi:DUF5684 domain-containing protein [Luteibaculum oceani]|uniref:Signal peptidase I n=1 Tax=Luteibaculum oceani TaxID=1294296 RepID=A0A5C6V1V9_9FLAO|nr:DUF5684 domain-containing protein [Luteibaculum oceani]TXC78396.1 hypothetical protein FRX97_08685 [Luteibaculum oceani]
MEFFETAIDFISDMSMGAKLVILLLFFVGSVGQWKLYDKAGQNGWTIFVPVLNLIVLNRVVGRPASHVWYYFIPVFNIFFTAKVFIEVCQSFGKRSIIDYVLVILLNGFYILNLGLSYDETYKGPVYKENENKDDATIGNAEFA